MCLQHGGGLGAGRLVGSGGGVAAATGQHSPCPEPLGDAQGVKAGQPWRENAEELEDSEGFFWFRVGL